MILSQPELYICGLIAISLLIIISIRHFHDCDKEMSVNLLESKRTEKLTQNAMQRYPEVSMQAAIALFLQDMEQEIIQLKANALKTDVVYILEGLFRDKRLLQQEAAHLIRIDLEYNTGFDVRCAAQV